jgi:hypothetical protein
MAFSLSNVLAVEAEGITPYERELLQFSKDICDREVGIKKYELGLETQIVDGPDLILESRVGVYYTGRVEMIRWGKDFDVPLSKYQWNPDKGNRWWCGFEKVVNFYDELGNWVRFTGGPNRTRDFRGAREITIIRLGEKPDWELFPGINRPRGE